MSVGAVRFGGKRWTVGRRRRRRRRRDSKQKATKEEMEEETKVLSATTWGK